MVDYLLLCCPYPKICRYYYKTSTVPCLLKTDIISIIIKWVCKLRNVDFGKEVLFLFQHKENENVLRMDMTAVLVETGILLKATKPT